MGSAFDVRRAVGAADRRLLNPSATRRLGFAFATAAGLALAACASGESGLNVGAASLAPQQTTFNPFADESSTTSPIRQVIKNPTLAQVLEPGPLEEMTVGRAAAPVTVVKYFSPTCPFCRAFQAKVYPEFKRTYVDTGKVRLILREFPIGHQSGAATIAIRCAPKNRRVALYEDLLRNHARWVSQEVRRDPIFRIAKRHGLTRERFDACFADEQLIANLKQVKDRGRTLGIIGTPNFFINERLEKRVLTMDAFREIIDPLLAGAPTATAADGQRRSL